LFGFKYKINSNTLDTFLDKLIVKNGYIPFLKVGNLRMWMLTPTATATMTNCIGSTSIDGRKRLNKKTVEKPIVAHNNAKTAIFVFKGMPLPSL